jgi:hypothetical protein
LPKRQQLSARNETSLSVSATKTWAEHVSSLLSSSTTPVHAASPALLINVVSPVVTISPHQSSHISSTLLSESTKILRTSVDDTLLQSRIAISLSSSYASTLEQQSRSSIIFGTSSSQRLSLSDQVPRTSSLVSVLSVQSVTGRISSLSLVASSTSEQSSSPAGVLAHTTSHVDIPRTISQLYLSLVTSDRRETRSESTSAPILSNPESHVDALSITSTVQSVPLATAASQLSAQELLYSSHGSASLSLVSIPGARTPLSIPVGSPTLRPETAQELPSTPSTLLVYAMGSGNSNAAPPLVSSSPPAVSKSAAKTSSSAAPSRPESSAYVGLIKTRALSSYSIVSYSSFVLPSIGSGNLTLVASATPSQPTPVRASMNGFIPTSESIQGTPSGTTQPTRSSFVDDMPTGIFYSNASGTGVSSRPSDVAVPSLAVTNSAMSLVALAKPSSTSYFNTSTIVHGAGSTIVLKPSLLLSTQHVTSSTYPTASIVTVLVNTTSIVASQALSKNISTYQGWNFSAQTNAAQSAKSTGRVATSTGLAVDSNGSQSSTPHIFPVPSRNNLTVSNTVVNSPPTISSTTLAGGVSRIVSHDERVSSTLLTTRSYGGLRKTVSPPIKSATESATASPLLPPPLTTSQTAGVAIAGTAGLLIAIVAAIYIARRYHNKRARRTSSGSVYPKVAYLYDPSTGGSDRYDHPEQAFMSGASSGMPSLKQISRALPYSPERNQARSTETLPTRFSDPGNPFREGQDTSRHSNQSACNPVRTPMNAVAAIAAAIRGYSAASQDTTTVAGFPVTNTLRDNTCPSPALNPVMSDAISPSRSSILGEIASMAYNHNVCSDATTPRCQPLLPYGSHPKHSLPRVRETTYSESVRDPFEHDLLLQVDPRLETQDSMTVYAPTTASVQAATTAAPIKAPSNNPWASSMLDPHTSPSTYRPDSRQSRDATMSPNTTIVASERYSLVYDKHTSTTYITPSQAERTVSPPLCAVHRGWDDIKRYSADKVVPSIKSYSPQLGYMSSPPIKKVSLPQLRRKELTLASSRDSLLANTRLSLNVKVPFSQFKSSSDETSKLSQLVARGRNDDARSPDSAFSQSVQSLALLMQHRKKSGDMEFACAGVR